MQIHFYNRYKRARKYDDNSSLATLQILIFDHEIVGNELRSASGKHSLVASHTFHTTQLDHKPILQFQSDTIPCPKHIEMLQILYLNVYHEFNTVFLIRFTFLQVS